MSGPIRDLSGQPNQSACDGCGVIWSSHEKARECQEEHDKKARRDRARAYARTGISQFKKPEASK